MLFPLPEHLTKRQNDYVSYTAKDDSGLCVEKNEICYAKHMNVLTETEIECIPRRDAAKWSDFFIDFETYLRFVQVLKDHNIITANTVAWIEEGKTPKMLVPRGISRHRAYAALCAYRWAESLSPLPWQTVKLYDDMPEVTFWQILHYVMAVHVSSVGHNWCFIGQTANQYIYCNYGQAFNMALSLAFPFLWYKTEEEMLKEGNSSKTCDRINTIALAIAPQQNVKGSMNLPSLFVNGTTTKCDVLNTVWTPLYKLASCAAVSHWENSKVQTELAAMYKDILDKHPELAKVRDEVVKKISGSCRW